VDAPSGDVRSEDAIDAARPPARALTPAPIDPRTLRGLGAREAAARLRADGPNEVPRAGSRSAAIVLRDVLTEPMIALLVAVGIVYLLLGEPREAAVLLASIVIVIGIELVQAGRTERTLQALRDLSSPRALVIRDGLHLRIAGRDVVRGDLAVVAEGDRVPADGVLVWSENLEVDESLLTGESVPVSKRGGSFDAAVAEPGGDASCSVFSGTLVVRGQGVLIVRAVGASTAIGRIGGSLATLVPEPSPLQREMGRLVRVVGTVALGVCVLAAVAYGLRRGSGLEGLLVGLTFAISMVPEEFPVILTVLFAFGARRIAQRGVLTRRLPAIEALGATTVLCVDKTGTLTENRMAVQELSAGGATWTPDPSRAGELPEAFHTLLEFAVLASQRDPFDPMEVAFTRLARAQLGGTEHLHETWTHEREYPLSHELLALSHVWSAPDATRYVVAAKGAPEAVLDLCHLSAGDAAAIGRDADAMARRGLRVLGVARAEFARGLLPRTQHDFAFAFLGLVGLRDPVRERVPAAIAECRTAGIRVVMITGDHAHTARTIAEQVGLGSSATVVTGAEMHAMSDDELATGASTASVFARVTPDQKLRLVQALAARDEVVAMTGDGVNDAPALKAAHVGIAMGGRGTDVAREAAALVLLDDDFTSIVAAVRLGRRIYDNVRKSVTFVLAAHVAIAGMALVPLLVRWPLLLMPVHVLFLELIIDPTCSLVFEAQADEPGLMRRPPRSRRSPLLTTRVLRRGVLQGTSLLAVLLTIFAVAHAGGAGDAGARTLAFVSLVAGNLGLILANQSWTERAWRTPFWRNRMAIAVTAGAGSTLALILAVPWLRELFHFALPPTLWLVAAPMSALASVFWVDLLGDYGTPGERSERSTGRARRVRT
jgi:Ca2+-transporting ATPase